MGAQLIWRLYIYIGRPQTQTNLKPKYGGPQRGSWAIMGIKNAGNDLVVNSGLSKVCHTPRSVYRRGAHLPSLGREPVSWMNHRSLWRIWPVRRQTYITVTFPATGHHRPLTSTKIWWQRHMCANNLPKVVTRNRNGWGVEPATVELQVQRSNRSITRPHILPICKLLKCQTQGRRHIRTCIGNWWELTTALYSQT